MYILVAGFFLDLQFPDPMILRDGDFFAFYVGFHVDFSLIFPGGGEVRWGTLNSHDIEDDQRFLQNVPILSCFCSEFGGLREA